MLIKSYAFVSLSFHKLNEVHFGLDTVQGHV